LYVVLTELFSSALMVGSEWYFPRINLHKISPNSILKLSK